MLNASRFRVDLTEQVEVDRIVDGDKVVNLCDGAGIVGVADRSTHAGRVVVDEVVQLLCTGTECEGLTAAVDGLLGTGNLTCHCDVNKRIDVHFGVNAEVFEVGLCNQGADCVGHTADAELETSAVGDFFHDELCNRLIDCSCSTAAAQNPDGGFVFYDVIDLGNVDTLFKTAQAARHIGVDLDDDNLCALAHSSHVGSVGAKAEIAVLVHRGDLEHGDIDGFAVFTNPAGQFGVAQRTIEGIAVGNHLALDARHMPGVPGQALIGFGSLKGFQRAQQDTAANVHVMQFGHTLCKCVVKDVRGTGAPAKIHPIAGLYDLNGLFRSCFFALIFLFKRHRKSSSFDTK